MIAMIHGSLTRIEESDTYECPLCNGTIYPNSISIERRLYEYNGERMCLNCAMSEAGIERVYE